MPHGITPAQSGVHWPLMHSSPAHDVLGWPGHVAHVVLLQSLLVLHVPVLHVGSFA
jgi:hypothetical protein